MKKLHTYISVGLMMLIIIPFIGLNSGNRAYASEEKILNLTANFINFSTNLGQSFIIRVFNPLTNQMVANTRKVIIISQPDFSISFDNIPLAKEYWDVGFTYYVDFYVDVNNNGKYDAPPYDHSWREMVINMKNDTSFTFANNNEYYNLYWVDSTGTTTTNISDTILTTTNHTYSPAELTVNIGDKITIMASTFHPLVQVSKETWGNSGNTPLASGWGTKTTPYTFTVATYDTIYFVCSIHVIFGMKGKIIVNKIADVLDLSLNHINISLYPNPVSSSGNLHIQTVEPTNLTAKVFDYLGNLVKSLMNSQNLMTNESNNNFNVSNFESGNYFIVVSDERKEYVLKMIVIK